MAPSDDVSAAPKKNGQEPMKRCSRGRATVHQQGFIGTGEIYGEREGGLQDGSPGKWGSSLRLESLERLWGERSVIYGAAEIQNMPDVSRRLKDGSY